MSVIGHFSHRISDLTFRFLPFVLVLAGFFCGILSMAPADTLAAVSQVIHEGSFHSGDLRWEADSQGVPYPVFDNTRPLTEPGLPQLPAREMVLLVPVEMEVTSLWIEPVETHREAMKNALAIAPAHFTDSHEYVTTTRMDRRDGSFPSVWGEFTGSHFWRGYRLATISIYPVREIQTDSGSELEYLDRFAVRMETGAPVNLADIAVRQRLVAGEAEENAQILAQLVDNPEVISGYRRENGQLVENKSAAFERTYQDPEPSRQRCYLPDHHQ